MFTFEVDRIWNLEAYAAEDELVFCKTVRVELMNNLCHLTYCMRRPLSFSLQQTFRFKSQQEGTNNLKDESGKDTSVKISLALHVGVEQKCRGRV